MTSISETVLHDDTVPETVTQSMTSISNDVVSKAVTVIQCMTSVSETVLHDDVVSEDVTQCMASFSDDVVPDAVIQCMNETVLYDDVVLDTVMQCMTSISEDVDTVTQCTTPISGNVDADFDYFHVSSSKTTVTSLICLFMGYIIGCTGLNFVLPWFWIILCFYFGIFAGNKKSGNNSGH